MKCSIIRDLLPLYCDNLTSADSNEEIENHLRNCTECTEIYENISKEEIVMTEQDKNIKPLKKVKKHFLIRLICSILGTAVVLFGVFMFAFYGFIPISSDDLSWEIKTEEQYLHHADTDENGEPIPETETKEVHKFLQINFTGNCQAIRIKNDTDAEADAEGKCILNYDFTFYPVFKNPFITNVQGANKFVLGLDLSGSNNDKITIHCRDKDMTYYVKDLAEESSLNLE